MALFASRGYGETRWFRRATPDGRLLLTDAEVAKAEAKIERLRALPGDEAGMPATPRG